MNVVEAAHRLGVAEHMVLVVEEHPAGHLATLRNGVVMLVADTVARVYVPEVDDPDGTVASIRADREAFARHLAPEQSKPKPKAAPKRKTSGGSGS